MARARIRFQLHPARNWRGEILIRVNSTGLTRMQRFRVSAYFSYGWPFPAKTYEPPVPPRCRPVGNRPVTHS